MYEVLNAIANGMKGAYAYREDEEYMDQNTEESHQDLLNVL